MSWSDEIARTRAWVEAKLATALAQLFLVTLTAGSSALGNADSVESSDEGRDPGAPASEKKGSRPVARYQPWGFQGRPPKGVRGLALRLGSSNLIWIGIAPTQAYGPQNLDVGETCLFCSSDGTRVYLDKNGAVHVDAASGQDVIVNGGTLQVARKTDKTVADTTMAAFISAVCAKFNAPAAPMASAPGSITPPTDFGVINGGAAHFKG